MPMPAGPEIPPPSRRRLRTFAFDPMTSRLEGRLLTLDVPYEDLEPGPVGRLLAVIDHDPIRDLWYTPVDLDHPSILAQDGLEPSEADPRSHQQIVYAVASSVIERFERFMGRRFRLRQSDLLTLVPHAFEGSNAFFHPQHGVLFGYYDADPVSPGANLPGQTIFTCLSSDIVAHEVTHAIIHRLRPFYIEPTHPDMVAIHEGVSDLVALFQHFAHREIVQSAIAQSSSDIVKGTGLFDLAREFGESTGRGAALRTAIDERARSSPEALAESIRQYATSTDPHARAANFVVGVFDAFLSIYQSSIADLLRIATGGTGTLPPGRLHPDLVSRVTSEAVKTADRFLAMVVRSFDYMPVVDATFGDLVRAIVTADHDLYPADEGRLRATLVEALRARGIHPDVAALSDTAMRWPEPPVPLTLTPSDLVQRLLASGTLDMDLTGDMGGVRTSDLDSEEGTDPVRGELEAWCAEHAEHLGLDPRRASGIRLRGVHVSYRLAADGQPRPEIVLKVSQNRDDLAVDFSGPDGEGPQEKLHVRAGTVLILKADGTVKYVIAKSLPSARDAIDEPGVERLAAIYEWVAASNAEDPTGIWLRDSPAVLRMDFARLHQEGL